MKLDAVSYLFTMPELDALFRLTGCAGLPGLPPREPQPEAGLASLENALLLSRTENDVAVDKVTAYLAKTVGDARRFVCVPDEKRYIGLFCDETLVIVVRQRRGRWLLTPYPVFEQGRDALSEAATGPAAGRSLLLRNGMGSWQAALPEPGDRPPLLSRAAAWAYFNEAPSGKEFVLWKP